MRTRLLVLGAFVALAAGCRTRPAASPLPEPQRAATPAVVHLSPGTPLPFRALSYNVAQLPLGIRDGPRRLARLPGAVAAFEADVVGLQEVWTVDARSAFVRAAPHAAGRQGGGGLLLLSRHPVREEQFVRFPSDGRSSLVEQLAGKGVLDAVLDTPVGEVRVIVSHLEAEEARVREAQLDVLLRRVREAHAGLPVVILADLNFQPTDDGTKLAERYGRLLAAGLVDVRRSDTSVPLDLGAPTFRGWPRRRDGSDPGAWFDYVLLAPGTTTRVRATGYRVALDTAADALSDHNLLVAELEFLRTQ